MKKMAGADAFLKALRNKARRYPGRNDTRVRDNLLFPVIEPGFKISSGQSVFTIGSCFARNVEDSLLNQGLDVPTAHFKAPYDEAPGRPNRILNQYNTGTMLQLVRALGQPIHDKALYKQGIGKRVDCLLATGSRPTSTARAMERRQEIADLYNDGLAKADLVVITLGLVEAWFDTECGLYLNEAPPRKLLDAHNDRFEFHQLDVESCSAMLFEMLERLIEGGRRNVILTVSPVPLQATFAGGDAVTRNAYSKAVLRVVAEQATQAFEQVDYYPSYETITTSGMYSYGEDLVHVRPLVVEKVVSNMVEHYMAS
jgi:hypothetical protein